jgi:hypothetical protein
MLSRFGFLVFLFFYSLNLFSQPSQLDRNKDSYNWMLGASWNLVSPMNDFGNIKGYQFPTRFFVDKHYYSGWSWEGALAFGKFDTIAVRPDSLNTSTSFFSFDANIRYSFQKMLYPSTAIDPYISYGLGLTNRSILGTHVNGNVAVGINFWFSSNLGIQLQSSAKIALTSGIMKPDKHYLQHTIGLALRIPEGSITDNSFNKRRYKKIKIIRDKPKKKKKKKKDSDA